jgi:hypothetical protein
VHAGHDIREGGGATGPSGGEMKSRRPALAVGREVAEQQLTGALSAPAVGC